MRRGEMKEGGSGESIQVSCFLLDETHCGIDISRVQEINDDLTITPVPLAPDYVLGIMNLRGRIVTVIDLSRKLGFRKAEIGRTGRIIIVRWQNEYAGMLVEKVTEILAIDSGEIAEPPSNIRGLQGSFFRGVVKKNGKELLAVLDLEAILAE
ncbi:chemotaxis protein CheW [Thiovibrio sp. JS02]